MLKRIVIALVGLLAMLALAVAPASGAAEVDGTITLYEGPNRGAPSDVIDEADIPEDCEAIPDDVVATVRSVDNDTSNPGTPVDFFAASDTTCSNEIVPTVQPGTSELDIKDPANETLGAGRWKAASS